MRMPALLLPVVIALAAAPAAHAAVANSHSGWNWGNPQPQGNSLLAIDFADGSGYAAGSFGTIVKTTDSGVTWSGLQSGTTARLTRVRALDANVVFAGGGCALRRSDDGGATFRRLAALPSERRCAATIRSFSFSSAQVGNVLLSDGTVLRTEDGGTSFAARAAVPGTAAAGGSPAAPPGDIFLVSDTTGFATAGGNIFRSTDGGATWTPIDTGTTPLNALYLDGNSGYAAGDGKTVLVTSNGGTTWNPRTVDADVPAGDLTGVDCAPGNANRCLFATEQGDQLVRTNNGGGSFTSVRPSTSSIAAAAFNTNQAAVAVGELGATALSANGGSEWTPVGQTLAGTLTRLRATPTGVLALGEDGTLLRTGGAGADWNKPNVSTSEDVLDASFPSSAVGYALDAAGDVRRTTDGGGTWAPVGSRATTRPRAILAPDENTVVLVGRRLTRSTDAGATFRAVRGGAALQRSEFTDFDASDGAFFFYGPRALFSGRADAGGLRRVRRPGGRRATIASADFVTATLGYVLNADGRVWKTRDRGRHWSELRGTGTAGAYGMAWADALNGYLAVGRFGSSGRAGYVLRTSDGGRSWRPQLVAPSPLAAHGLLATAAQTAFALADGNQLLSTTSGGDLGAPSTITISSRTRRIRGARRVTVSGSVAPAVGGAEVHVLLRPRSGRRWTVRRAVTAADGSFSVRARITRSTVAVAQWLGDPGHNGDGSNILVIRRVR